MERIILKKSHIWKILSKENAIEILGVIGIRKYFYHTKAEAKQKYSFETKGKIARGEVYDL